MQQNYVVLNKNKQDGGVLMQARLQKVLPKVLEITLPVPGSVFSRFLFTIQQLRCRLISISLS